MTAPRPGPGDAEAGSGGAADAELGAGCFAPRLQTWGFRLAGGGVLPAGAVSGRVVTLRAAGGLVYEGARVTGYRWGPGQPGVLVIAGGAVSRPGTGRQAMTAPVEVFIAEVQTGHVRRPGAPEETRERAAGPARALPTLDTG